MEKISFQGRNLATARRIWERMLGDDCTIFLGLAGALSAGGLRLVIAHLIEHRYVDCLVSTGANLYHDLHETRGRRHYIGSPRENDALLQGDRIDRVYDTYASEEEFIENDEWIAAFALTLERRPYTSREFLYRLGEHLWTTTGGDGHPDRGLPRLGADLLPGHRRFVASAWACRRRAIAIAAAGPRRRHRRHHRVGEPRHPPAAHRVGRARRRHAEELHQPGERAGGVLRRSRQRPPLRAADRDRRAALRRRVRRQPRRGPELGQARGRRRAGHGARRRDHRAAAARQRAGRQRARDPGGPEAAALRSFGPVMAVDGRPLPQARFEERER